MENQTEYTSSNQDSVKNQTEYRSSKDGVKNQTEYIGSMGKTGAKKKKGKKI